MNNNFQINTKHSGKTDVKKEEEDNSHSHLGS